MTTIKQARKLFADTKRPHADTDKLLRCVEVVPKLCDELEEMQRFSATLLDERTRLLKTIDGLTGSLAAIVALVRDLPDKRPHPLVSRVAFLRAMYDSHQNGD